MAELIATAPAKVNLHLEVLGLRSDGFHELAMLMASIDLVDELRLTPTADGRLQLTCDQPGLSCGADNLIVRAAELLRQRAGLPELGVRMHLLKRIPIGAGLAGGSSDAAAALVGLDALWGLGFGLAKLAPLAAELGSDVPFCLAGGSQLCFGRGEQLEPLRPPLPPLGVLLLKDPAVSVSTPWAYGRCREQQGGRYLKGEPAFEGRRQALRQSPLLVALAQGERLPPLRNDLQAVVEPALASVAQGLRLLRQAPNLLAAAMSGSGPSLFALFPDRHAAEAAQQRLLPELEAAGLEAWSCSLQPGGVRVDPAAVV